MTDLEMTKICAEAMGLPVVFINDAFGQRYQLPLDDSGFSRYYDPLSNDSQAMALIKKFPGIGSIVFQNADLHHKANSPFNINRAIVVCVARMKEAK